MFEIENKFEVIASSKYHIVLENDSKYNLVSENTPPSIAAGSIYLVSVTYDMNISKKEISDNTGISIVTIQKIVKIISELEK